MLGSRTTDNSNAMTGQDNQKNKSMRTLNMTQEWDKTFPKSDKVVHSKVTFENRYGITLAADLYVPKGASGRLAAIVVCGPYGAVKEQCSGLYAQIMAERGFLTLAFDPSYCGESGGQPRFVSSPDINTEDYSAAIDYLILRDDVDENRIGVIGICGWGGLAISAAVMDTRIKATVSSTMGAFDTFNTPEERYEARRQLNEQRTIDARNGNHALAGGVPDTLPADAPQFMKDYQDYYKTSRGYHPRSLNSNAGWQTITNLPFFTFPLMAYADEIKSAVLVVHGDKAYSLDASKDAYSRMKGDNKELLLIPGASHTDLYDQLDIIPFDKFEEFFKQYLK